jgi:hypothetical protein
VTDALYTPAGDGSTYHSGPLTVGPWGADLQHGGPPSALLVREFERLEGAWPFTVVRHTVEILGPVPVTDVRVEARVVRSGRSVEMVEGELTAGGRVALRARAWRIRQADLDLPPDALGGAPAPPMPAEDTALPDSWTAPLITAFQMRFVHGGWRDPGPATVWARLRPALVDGEEPTPLQRLMVLADSGNGISNALPPSRFVFINPELTVHLSRYPEGEWMCLEASTVADPHGFGLAYSQLYDERGLVGRGAQSLFLGPRDLRASPG